MALLKSFTYDDKSKVWLEPFSVILNCMLPAEYIYGDWYMWISKVEASRSNPENICSMSADRIETGSRAEGFCIPQYLVSNSEENPLDALLGERTHWEPDLDSMTSLDFLVENDHQQVIPIFVVHHAEDDPRYVQLRFTEEWKEHRPRYRDSTFLHHSYVLPSGRGHDKFLQALNDLDNPKRAWTYEMHGPVRKLESKGLFPNYEEDDTAVFRYPQAWPESAMEWLVRPRPGSWPSAELLQDIFESGCHIAPVGRGKRQQEPMEILDYVKDPTKASTSKENQNTSAESSTMDETEWRLSFSVAENKLGQSVTPVQRHVIVLLKILKKLYFSDFISSYLLKNLLFWEIEKQDESFWREDRSAKYIVYMLDRLAQCLEDGCLPHYIIPESNLLKYEDPVKLAEGAAIVREVRQSILAKSVSMLKRLLSMSYQSSTFLRGLDLRPFLASLQDNTSSDDVVQKTISCLYSIFTEKYKECFGSMLRLLQSHELDKSVENEIKISANIYKSLLARSLTKQWFLSHGKQSNSNDFTSFVKKETASLPLDDEFMVLSLMFFEEAQKDKDLASLVPSAMEPSKQLRKAIAYEHFAGVLSPLEPVLGWLKSSDFKEIGKIVREKVKGMLENITMDDIEAEVNEEFSLLFKQRQTQE